MSDRATIYRLAIATSLNARTVERVLHGEHVRPSTRAHVLNTAKKLRIELPAVATTDAARAA